MSVEIADREGMSFLHRLIRHARPLWVTITIALALFLITIGAAF